ncbi:hypothetical protein E5288_WYG011569 [Bos mutus]|uniref:Uncharacterized protein n=1 Tax=Bos mutus TaxID=72004 RepID=A0A6B0RLZ8_9CETA|nr:hypothetical protein [Bos mutus]
METTANCAVGKAHHLLESPREIVSDEALLPLPASVRIITASPPPGSPSHRPSPGWRLRRTHSLHGTAPPLKALLRLRFLHI